MNAVLESLLELVQVDPLPSEHTSSQWRLWGAETVVERHGEALELRSSGFENLSRMSLRGRLLHTMDRWSYRLVTAPLQAYPRVWRVAKRLIRDLSAHPNYTLHKSACILSLLVDHWTTYGVPPKTVALIGDGQGILGALIRRYLPGVRLYCIDLPKILVFQVRTHQLADPQATMALLSEDVPVQTADVTFVLPQRIERVPDQIDCAINVVSMQEMTAYSIQAYFTFLRRRSTPSSRFYCVNRLRREMPGGEVSSFYDYPWHKHDQIFIDGPCPYYTHFIAPYTLPNGPRVCGARVPCINYFDGVIFHRLVRLAPLPPQETT